MPLENHVMGQLENRVAIVTGGSRGIGKATARRLGKEGARVAVFDIDEDVLSAARTELSYEGNQAIALRVDVTDRTQVEQAMAEVRDRFGRIDILVNNAGVIRDNLLFRMTDEDWQQVMDVHLKGSFVCSQIAQKYMVEESYGRIVNLSSTSALGNRGQANYSAAKAGLQGFTKTLAIELGKFGITVNAVAPGLIDTDMTRATAKRMGLEFDQFVEANKEWIPAGRVGTPDDVAGAVLFFALESSSFVNGQVLYVAGGPKA